MSLYDWGYIPGYIMMLEQYPAIYNIILLTSFISFVVRILKFEAKAKDQSVPSIVEIRRVEIGPPNRDSRLF